MTDPTIALLAAVVGPCPTCGHGRLQDVCDGEDTNLLCQACGSCWHTELGWVRRVDPQTCPGCPSRGVCKRQRG